jgi:hypothetical protein
MWSLDVDLGELCDGHHVIARSVTNEPPQAELRYVFTPGLSKQETSERPFFWYWMVYASDDLDTPYNDWNSGVVDEESGGTESEGSR